MIETRCYDSKIDSISDTPPDAPEVVHTHSKPTEITLKKFNPRMISSRYLDIMIEENTTHFPQVFLEARFPPDSLRSNPVHRCSCCKNGWSGYHSTILIKEFPTRLCNLIDRGVILTLCTKEDYGFPLTLPDLVSSFAVGIFPSRLSLTFIQGLKRGTA